VGESTFWEAEEELAVHEGPGCSGAKLLRPAARAAGATGTGEEYDGGCGKAEPVEGEEKLFDAVAEIGRAPRLFLEVAGAGVEPRRPRVEG
jgi:hypothetical protein